MKKALLYLLLLANLCSGLAFAWDTHPEAMTGHDVTAFDTVADDDSHHHSGSDLHHDNHSCHGTAHLMGIIYSTTPPIAATSCSKYAFPTVAIPFRYLDPHLRPPIL